MINKEKEIARQKMLKKKIKKLKKDLNYLEIEYKKSKWIINIQNLLNEIDSFPQAKEFGLAPYEMLKDKINDFIIGLKSYDLDEKNTEILKVEGIGKGYRFTDKIPVDSQYVKYIYKLADRPELLADRPKISHPFDNCKFREQEGTCKECIDYIKWLELKYVK